MPKSLNQIKYLKEKLLIHRVATKNYFLLFCKKSNC